MKPYINVWVVSAVAVSFLGCDVARETVVVSDGGAALSAVPGPCDRLACGAHGQCIMVDADPVCTCDAGYHWDGRACQADASGGTDLCLGITCGGHGRCITDPDGPGTPYCACDDGWRTDTDRRQCVENPKATSLWQRAAAGWNETAAIADDGTLWWWGDGSYYGATQPRRTSVPVLKDAGTDWVSVTGAVSLWCALKRDGSLWCWGTDQDGLLGTGDSEFPVRIGDATDWVSISRRGKHNCGIRSDGSLWCWGANGVGEMGIGTHGTCITTPTEVGGEDWAMVSAGHAYTCALKTDGSLWCWGDNERHGIGDGSDALAVVSPVNIGAGTVWSTVSAGVNTCAVKSDGTLWCWGELVLDDGNLKEFSVPTQIGADTDWRSVDTAGLTCATKRDGSLWCSMADPCDAKGGDGAATGLPMMFRIGGDTDWAALSTSEMGHLCALKTGGGLYCWGRNQDGEVGNGDMDTDARSCVPEPFPVNRP